MASLMPVAKQQFFIPGTSIPLVGGNLYTYAAGTSTPKATFQDPGGVTPNTNPITLDSTGSALIYWDGSYKVVIKDALGNTVYTVDNYIDPASTFKASGGASLIGFIQAGSGAVLRTVQDKGRDWADVTDFMSSAQIADARAYGYTFDSTAAFNAALVAGQGAIRIPPGGYIAKGLTIPAGVTVISVQGGSAVNNYYERANSTIVRTQGSDFVKGGATSMLFCARDIFIEGSGQTGICFGTTSAVETGFAFENVGISGFQYGFYAPQYSSSSFARDTSLTDCDYGLWSIKESNNTKTRNMGYNRCANAVRICGFGANHAGAQISLGYTGANAASFPVYIGFDLFTGLNTVSDVYHEDYGLDYSKNILYNCRSSTFGDDHYKLDTFLSSKAGLRHLRVYSENLTQAIKSNLIEINGSVPNNCPTIETISGQTGLIRGIKVNGRTFNAVAGTRAVFDTYDVEAVIAAGAAKVTTVVTAFGTTAVTLVGFDSPSITGFSDFINNANTTAATGCFFFKSPDYHHCPLGSNGKTSALYEISADIAIDGLAAAKTYAVGVVYKIPGGAYAIKKVGEYKALARPGSAVFDFSAIFKENVRANTASSIGICFIPSASVDVPAAIDITGSLYGKIRVRFLED